VTSASLARSYLEKAKLRLEVVELLLQREGYSDVVREAQELVELATKAMLRHVGIEPPKWHDVGSLLVDQSDRFAEDVRPHLSEVARISRELRKEREFSFYGDEDFIPTEEYGRADAEQAVANARFVLELAGKTLARS
jgi:hypothetical protein